MKPTDINKSRSLTSFSALFDYLGDELDWPIEVQDAVDLDDLFYSYEPAELGIDQKHAVKIESIKQFRPLVEGRPWGIFYLQFESKRLPVGCFGSSWGAWVSRRPYPHRGRHRPLPAGGRGAQGDDALDGGDRRVH